MKKNEQVSGPPTIRPVEAPTFVSYEITGELLPDKRVAKLPVEFEIRLYRFMG